MNYKEKIVLVLTILFVCAVSAFVCTSLAEAKGPHAHQRCLVEGYEPSFYCNKSTEEKNFFPRERYREEGYDNFVCWWDDVKAKQAEFEGRAAEVVEKYKDYLSEDEIKALQEHENNIVKTYNLTDIKEEEKKFNAIVEEADRKKTEAELNVSQSAYADYQAAVNSGSYSGSYYDFLVAGVVYHGGNKFTYYSQSVLPGGGLNIPGRHVSGGFVCDGDGYIVIANSAPNGTIIDTPFGPGKVYDKGTSGNHYDIYVE